MKNNAANLIKIIVFGKIESKIRIQQHILSKSKKRIASRIVNHYSLKAVVIHSCKIIAICQKSRSLRGGPKARRRNPEKSRR